jgi:hypothetical protein
MEKRKRKKTGDIFEISLEPYFPEYVYAKYVDISKVYPMFPYPDMLIIFDFFSKNSITDINKIIFEKKLMNHCFISGGYGMAKKWRILGNLGIDAKDLFVPYTKRGRETIAKSIKDFTGWFVLDNYRKFVNDRVYTADEVAHLDVDGTISIDAIPFRVALERYKKDGKDISKYLEMDFFEKYIYDWAIEMPLMSVIPTELVGRMI